MKRLIWPALTTLVMLVILLSLGFWQLQRLAWKQGLLDQIALAEARPAVDLPDTPPAFAKIRVTGQFADHWALYGAEGRDTAKGPVLGAQLLGVLERDVVKDRLVGTLSRGELKRLTVGVVRA